MKSALVLVGMLGAMLNGQNSATPRNVSSTARQYLDRALDLMKAESLHTKEIDWRQLRKSVFRYAQEAQTTQETYPAIAFACTQLHQRYSNCLAEPAGTPYAVRTQVNAIVSRADVVLRGRPLTRTAESSFRPRQTFYVEELSYAGQHYTYLALPLDSGYSVEGSTPASRHQQAQQLYELIQKAITPENCGWVIDLRGHSNWIYSGPVFAGVQSLLGDGKILQIKGPHSEHTTSIKDGSVISLASRSSAFVEEKIDAELGVSQKDLPVVILCDHNTSGVGEALAIAFEGRKKTCFIGQHTAGYSNEHMTFPLSDGALLDINTMVVLDRHGRAYPEGIEPDLVMDNPPLGTPVTSDPLVLASEKWLQTQQNDGR